MEKSLHPLAWPSCLRPHLYFLPSHTSYPRYLQRQDLETLCEQKLLDLLSLPVRVTPPNFGPCFFLLPKNQPVSVSISVSVSLFHILPPSPLRSPLSETASHSINHVDLEHTGSSDPLASAAEWLGLQEVSPGRLPCASMPFICRSFGQLLPTCQGLHRVSPRTVPSLDPALCVNCPRSFVPLFLCAFISRHNSFRSDLRPCSEQQLAV